MTSLNVHFDFPTPPGTLFTTAQQVAGPAFSLTVPPNPPLTGVISGDIADLPVGGTGTFRIRLLVPEESRVITGTDTVSTSTFDPDNTNDSATDMHTVLDQPLTTTLNPAISGLVGKQLTLVAVQVFTDADPQGNVFDYTTTIDWGDGTAPTPAVVTTDGQGNFYALGTHTYATTGAYHVHAVSVDNMASATADEVATIGPFALNAVPSLALTGPEGAAQTYTLGFFTDASGTKAAGNYGVSINWGDGSTSAAATLTASGGGFNVSAPHTYVEEGDYFPTFIVTDKSTGLATGAVPQLHVTDPAWSGPGSTSPAQAGVNTGRCGSPPSPTPAGPR